MEDILKKAILTLKTGKGFETVPPKRNDDNSITMGYVKYSDSIIGLLNSIPADNNYQTNIKELKQKPVADYSLNEVYTYLTFINRGERFCEGHISHYIESGKLLELCNKLDELLHK